MDRATGHTAVMANHAPPSAIEAEADPIRRRHRALNYFPTPPWATRALLTHVLPEANGRVWEPAAGEGHMVHVLHERFASVFASDVHDHGGLDAVGSFVGTGPDVIDAPSSAPDWVITNPPFALALEFAERALGIATTGVAMLVRTAWLEGQERWERLFRDSPPSCVAVFVERVPMTLGRWDPDADTATAYAWVVWEREAIRHDMFVPRLMWLPPGCRTRLDNPDDRRRFVLAIEHGPDLFEDTGA